MSLGRWERWRIKRSLNWHDLLPEFCIQISLSEDQGQVSTSDLDADWDSKIQVSIFENKHGVVGYAITLKFDPSSHLRYFKLTIQRSFNIFQFEGLGLTFRKFK